MPQYNKADIGRAATQYGFIRDTFEKGIKTKRDLRIFQYPGILGKTSNT